MVHCSSPCKEPKVVKDEDKTGKSEEVKRKTTLQLEEELAKKFASGVDIKKKRASAIKAAAKTAAAKKKRSQSRLRGATMRKVIPVQMAHDR